jgi:polysaccharide export outer membrane protein
LIQDQNLIKDPVITVTFNNLYVTVIGSTGSVGRVNIDRDNFTLLDAIAQSGDLELTGLRENVRVIRETGIDKLISYEVNMCSAEDLYNSPVFYLQQKDVIYVEPNNKIKRTTTQYGTQLVNYTFWFSLISSTFGLIALFRK